MDNQTAIDILKSIKPTLMELECRTGKGVADALGVGIRAIEKQIPKKLIKKRSDYTWSLEYVCPNCDSSLHSIIYKYCPSCGQKLDLET